MNRLISIGIICLQCFACSTRTKEEVVMPLTTGSWRGLLHMQDQEVPFIFRVTYEEQKPVIYLINDVEKIRIDSVHIFGDSIYIPMDHANIFASLQDSTMNGLWTKHYITDYEIPFTATLGSADRFKITDKRPRVDLSAKWEMRFIKGQDSTKAIGLFEQQGHLLSGKVISVKSDYGYLSGIVSGDSMKLSTFDGDRAYLFKGKYEDDTLSGSFWSGNHWHEKFYAIKNDSVKLIE